MKTRTFITGMITICFLLLVLFCNKKQSSIEKSEVIKIGIVAPLTGEGATYGAAMKRGFDLVFENNAKYQLIYEDSKLVPKDGVNSLHKLISTNKVSIVYGAAASSVTLAMAPIAEKNKVVLFSSISSADEIKDSGDYIFRNMPRNEIQGKTAGEFLINHFKVKNIGILKENDDYGVNLSKSFKNTILSLGGKIVTEESYLSKDVNFRTQLLKIRNSHAEAIFIPGNYEESALILKQAKELNIQIPIIGGDGSYSPELINIAANASENFYCTIMGADETSELYLSFRSKFLNKYSVEPNVYDAYAYEAGLIIYTTLENVGSNSNDIKNYLYNNKFNSLTGVLTFDNFGEVNRSYSIVNVKNGNFEKVNF